MTSPGVSETHLSHRVGWLRAAVLGANDGILSTSSLVIGVAASNAGKSAVSVAGLAGLVAGAMSMAAGEYVSVSSQADTEAADIAKERAELDIDPMGERSELAAIYVQRGLDSELAVEVAQQLMRHDALGAHTRDELGLSEVTAARPVQAALTSAVTFATGAAFPLVAVILTTDRARVWVVAATSMVFLAVLGAIGARAGGAPVGKAMTRVLFWGALAMAVTAGIGKLFGAGL